MGRQSSVGMTATRRADESAAMPSCVAVAGPLPPQEEMVRMRIVAREATVSGFNMLSAGGSDAQLVEHLDEFLVEGFVRADALGEGHIDHLVVAHADHDVALALLDGLDGPHACTAGQDAVVGRGAAAALQVAQYGDAHVEAGELLLHTVGIVEGAALRTLRHDDDARLLRLAYAAAHELRQLVFLHHLLGDDGSLGTAGNGAVLRQETGVAAHHLDKEDALVGVRRVAYAVHAFHDGVHRRVVADGGVGAVEVVVDGAGQTDAGEVVLHAEVAGAGERAVAADDHQGVDLLLLARLVGLRHALGGHELLRAGGLQDGAAAGDDAADILRGEGLHLTLYQTVVTAVDTLDVETVVDAGAGDGANGRVHAGCIATRGEDANRLDLCHNLLAVVCRVTSMDAKVRKNAKSTKNLYFL